MSTATELLRRALDRIDWVYPSDIALKDEIRTYLAAEPEAEPVAWIHCQGEDYEELHTWSLTPECVSVGWTQYPLYRHPPKPEPARKPMTDEEIIQGVTVDTSDDFHAGYWAGIRFAEKHHGIGRGME